MNSIWKVVLWLLNLSNTLLWRTYYLECFDGYDHDSGLGLLLGLTSQNLFTPEKSIEYFWHVKFTGIVIETKSFHLYIYDKYAYFPKL